MKKRNLLIALTLILGAANLFPFHDFALAAYPEKPVTLIVTWGAGGANDLIARTIAETMKKYFPQPVVVVNRPGATGTIGVAEIAGTRPDGYTIGSTTMSALVIKPHQMKLPYNTPDDYTPIALVGTQEDFLCVLSDSPFKTLKDYIEYAKANPGKLRLGAAGIGHFTHLILETLKFQAKIDITDVHATSDGAQVALLLGKHVESLILTVIGGLPYIQAGKIRPLAVSSERRSRLMPDVPTFKELGYDNAIPTYTVLIGPNGIPQDRLSKFQEAYKKVSMDSNFIKFMGDQGFTVVYEDGADLKNRLWKDYKGNKDIFERIGVIKK